MLRRRCAGEFEAHPVAHEKAASLELAAAYNTLARRDLNPDWLIQRRIRAFSTAVRPLAAPNKSQQRGGV